MSDTFISNVTFRPHCEYCKGPNAHPHSKYGLICMDCYCAFRLETMFEERLDWGPVAGAPRSWPPCPSRRS